MPDDQHSPFRFPEDDAAAIEAAMICRWRWPPSLEALYEAQRAPGRRARAAYYTALSGVFFLLTSALDATNGHDVMWLALPWRLAFLPFALLCAACLMRLNGFAHARAAEIILNVLPPLMMMMMTQAIGEYAGPVADRYMLAAAFAVAALAATTPMTLVTARWLCGTSALAYPIVLACLPVALPLRTNLDLPVFAAGVLATAALIARRNEGARRASFLYRRRHEISANELNVMNAELLRLSSIDALTGLRNRRAFTGALHMHWQDRGQPLGLAIFDVDWFKAFNDSAGHAAGDAALQSVGDAAERAIRHDLDLAARIGGEEFAVIMPGVDREQAVAIGERLRAGVARLAMPHPGRPGRHLSISVGVAWCTAAQRLGHKPENLMHDADMALYAAKEAGRDRVVFAGACIPEVGEDVPSPPDRPSFSFVEHAGEDLIHGA